MTAQMDKILTVRVESATYAIDIEWVREILTIDKIAPLASNMPHVRGTLMVRGNPIPLIDLRKYFDKSTLVEERTKIVEILTERQQDHIDWLDELNSCVNENREFKKAIDPCKCAFGKWINTYKPDTPEIARELAAFDEPHREIHNIATEVLNLVKDGNTYRAKTRLADAKEYELKRIVSLFDQMKDYLLNNLRETAIIVGSNNNFCGFVVDSVNDIKSRSTFRSEDFGMTGARRGISHVISDSTEPVNILDVAEIMKGVSVKTKSKSEQSEVRA